MGSVSWNGESFTGTGRMWDLSHEMVNLSQGLGGVGSVSWNGEYVTGTGRMWDLSQGVEGCVIFYRGGGMWDILQGVGECGICQLREQEGHKLRELILYPHFFRGN